MRKILILSIDSDFINSLSQNIRPYYEELSATGEQNKVLFYRSSVFEYNMQTKSFHNSERFHNNKWEQVMDLQPDIIWYKSNTTNYFTRLIEEDFLFINQTKFIELANNKFVTSKVFEKESPKTFVLNKNNLCFFKENETVIIKPDGGSGGEGVRKIKIHQLSDGIINHNSGYIVQEMIDSSKGIPGIISSIHDIRFFILGNTLGKSVLLRTPPENDFRCNISQGGSSENIDFSKLPIDMQLFAKNIHKKIHNKFGIIFGSIDIVMANNRYYLIEFNSSPGVNLHAIGSPKLKEYHKTISLFFNNI